ncbi:unnamed protein product [Echinostoma caproni]|uniref:Uncharacterized protein n=1 Tax=Echinostoma caproni TaxID=27848 RepID=A0A183B5Y2_9TREM|nr:unnamed protein product [Echinostoma caproni]
MVLTSSAVSIPSTTNSERNGRSAPGISSTAGLHRSDMHNAGFEPDALELSEDYRPSQTLLVGGASGLANFAAVSGGADGTRLFQTLNAKSIPEASPIRSDLTTGRSISVDSSDDWATHPFFADGQLPHSLIRHPNCLPSEYSESVIQPVAQHIYSDYIPSTSKPSNATLVAGIDLVELTSSCPVLPEDLGTSNEFDSLHQTILAADFPSTTLVAASSVSSVALENEVITKKNEDEKDREKKFNGIGSGRAIPLKQVSSLRSFLLAHTYVIVMLFASHEESSAR